MRRKLKATHPDPLFLLPSDLREWLPSNHLAYFFNDGVEQLDLSPNYAAYPDDMGQPPYDSGVDAESVAVRFQPGHSVVAAP